LGGKVKNNKSTRNAVKGHKAEENPWTMEKVSKKKVGGEIRYNNLKEK